MKADLGIRRVRVALLLLACLAGGAIVRGDERRTVTFVHATDFHLLVDNLDNPRITRERLLNTQAATDLLTWLAGRRATDDGLKGLILTGDLDVDPCWMRPRPKGEEASQKPLPVAECITLVDKTWRTEHIARVATALAATPLPVVYLVPGNNDIANEASSDVALKFFNDFIAEVQTKVTQTNSALQIVNLGLCYAATDDAQCYADVKDTIYRLIPLPSYSFKNRADGTFKANSAEQQAQMARFAGLVGAAAAAGRRVIVITHTPEIDDPYALAQDRFQAVSPTKSTDAAELSKWSTWDVSKAALDEWKKVLEAPGIAGILAGHLHDSHREIYRAPYAWATTGGYRDFRRLFIAPPLAVKNQTTSPIQARGFSLIHLQSDDIRRELFWYQEQSRVFVADDLESSGSLGDQGPGRFWSFLRPWIKLMRPTTLQQLAVVFIALLAAFLTVVRVWQIPPSDNPLVVAASAGSASATPPAAAVFDPSPFAGHFGKTVIVGLGGLVAETVMQAFSGTAPSAADRHLYIAWFVTLFLLFLGASATIRGLVELIRARLILFYRPVRRLAMTAPAGTWTIFRDWASYWIRRFVGWLKSWQSPVMTFIDTFISLIQGKNQTITREFSKVVIEQHRNVLRVIASMRARLNDTIEQYLREHGVKVAPGDVRVNISVLSPDLSSVHYIARAKYSSVKEFGRRSVAWVAVFTGKIRWYKKSFTTEAATWKSIVLFDNSALTIAGDEKTVRIDSHYQDRNQDYEAFVVFPVPWPQRSMDGPYVKGAIQISFKAEQAFDQIWRVPAWAKSEEELNYASEEQLLSRDVEGGAGCQSEEVRLVLLDALAVVGEALRGFNENLYRSVGGPDQPLDNEPV